MSRAIQIPLQLFLQGFRAEEIDDLGAGVDQTTAPGRRAGFECSAQYRPLLLIRGVQRGSCGLFPRNSELTEKVVSGSRWISPSRSIHARSCAMLGWTRARAVRRSRPS